MKIAIFSTKPYDKKFIRQANENYSFNLKFFEEKLNEQNSHLAKGFDAVCAFVEDTLDENTIKKLKENNVCIISLRSAGFNNVDLDAAKKYDISVTNVPSYSPHAVAEHAIGLILALNRHIPKAYNRVRDSNFSLKNLIGFDIFGKTAGIIGTGKIGTCMAKILTGFSCKVLAYDKKPRQECVDLGVEYTDLDNLLKKSDIISIHCPLTPQTKDLINEEKIRLFKKGVMLINTSRGRVLNTKDVVEGLKSKKIGYLGLDVYEEEENLFYQNLSDQIIEDDVFARLLTMPNVIITAHQGFFTKEAMEAIADTTLKNIKQISEKKPCPNNLTKK